MKIINLLGNMTFKDWIIVLLVIFGIWTYFSMKKYEDQASRTLVVYNDTISAYKNKLGEEYQAKQLYIQEISDLKAHNKSLYDEVKSLKENPIVVVKTEIKYVKDTTKLDNSIEKIDSAYYDVKWNLAETYSPKNYFNISGVSRVKSDFSESNSWLNNLTIGSDLILDIIESKDKTHFQILTKSGNPNLKFTEIEGAFINPNKSKVIKGAMKQKNFGIGVYGGYGINAIPNNKVNSGFQIGVGVVWSPSFLRF